MTTTWADVRAGDELIIRGKRWLVVSISDGLGTSFPAFNLGAVVAMVDEDGVEKTGTPKPTAPVEIDRTKQHEELAKDLGVSVDDLAASFVQIRLGGVVLAEKEKDSKVWHIPKWETDGSRDAAYRYHLIAFHGQYVNDVKTKAGLDEAHQASHDYDNGRRIPHVHK